MLLQNKNKQREGFLGLMREQLHLQFTLLAGMNNVWTKRQNAH